MNVINENVIQTILSRDRDREAAEAEAAAAAKAEEEDVSSIQIVDWRVDGMNEKSIISYASELSRLVVRYRYHYRCGGAKGAKKGGQDGDGAGAGAVSREKIFIIKDPTKAPLYAYVKNFGWYDNEVTMYDRVFPQMLQQLAPELDHDEHSYEYEYFTPRQYYFDDETQLLVLQDLSQSGYKCADRVQKLDLEHCIYAVRSLAKLHALSVKLETTVGLPESVKRNAIFSADRASDLTAILAQGIATFTDCVPQHLKQLYPNVIADFTQLSAEKLIRANDDCWRNTRFRVLNHGDFNVNNIMYKYDESLGLVKNVKLIDFQLSHWNGPANDLLFFTITSMRFDVYRKHLASLLQIYSDTANKILRRLGCPVSSYENVSVSRLLDDIDTLYPYALYVLSCVLPFIMFDPQDPNANPIDAKSLIKDDQIDFSDRKDALYRKSYQETMIRWLQHFAQKGTLRTDTDTDTDTDEEK
ncbi:uncharacterized protein LOC135838134 [Planococcus citri]|uniref:uncharacterized protein LOC135838134 n=1 Tax=Planococcus citri TaxID=170843 RepID=UPI0031F8D8E6